jgi:hypothetical protein
MMYPARSRLETRRLAGWRERWGRCAIFARPASLDLNGAERSARMLASLCESGLPVPGSSGRHQEVRA